MTGGGASGRDRAERMLAKAAELEQQAARMRQVAEHVVTGAEGEEAVAATLDSLKPGGWVVLHDRWKAPRSPANIDHLVVGPMGLLVIDAKKWSGRVTFTNGTLRCNGYSRHSTIAATVETADLLRAELAVEGFGDVPVTAVLCFDGDACLTRAVEVSPSLFLVPRSQLTSWLAERPRLLVVDRAAALGAYLDRAHRPRAEPSRPVPRRPPLPSARSQPRLRVPPRAAQGPTWPAAPTPMPAASRPSVRRDRRRNGGKSLVKLAVLALAILMGIGALSHHESASTDSSARTTTTGQVVNPSASTSTGAAAVDGCGSVAADVGSVLGLAVTAARSSITEECEYRSVAGLVVAYTRVGPSVRQVSGMAALIIPTPVRLSCGEGFFQPAGHPLPNRPAVTARQDAASCVSNVRLGSTQAQAAQAARALVTVVGAGSSSAL